MKSAPGAGEAYAGQSAVADDASTAYLNPAGMTRLRGRQMVLGGQYLDLSMEFHSIGRSGVNAGRVNVVPAAYFVGSLTDRLRFGMSLNQPFGTALHYADDWSRTVLHSGHPTDCVELSPKLGPPREPSPVDRGRTLDPAGLAIEDPGDTQYRPRLRTGWKARRRTPRLGRSGFMRVCSSSPAR